MPFFNQDNLLSSFASPNELVERARALGVSDAEIAQMLLDQGDDPNAVNLFMPTPALAPAGPKSPVPSAQVPVIENSMFPTTPPMPDTPNNARVGEGDESYGDFSPDTFDQRIAAAADSYGVPRDVAMGLFNTENAPRNPYAINGSGSTAIGLGQLTEAARADYNKAHGTNFSREDFFDPDLNTDATFWYLTTRDGDTLDDKIRAYNQGNGGAAEGRGYGYLASVKGNAGPGAPAGARETMFANRGGATSAESMSVASAPPGYDEELPPPPMQGGTLLEGEPGGEAPISSDPKESPGFFGKLMNALSGPLGEGLMGMGAGILGARGTYGNTFQAIGQGGQQGLEAYGYAQRRAQRDREAAEAAKLAQQKLKTEEEARKYTRTNMKMQTFNSLSDKFGPKAMVKYLRANPDLLEQFGGSVDPSDFVSKEGWSTNVSNGYIIQTNKSGETRFTKLPDELQQKEVARTEKIKDENGNPIIAGYDKAGRRIANLGTPADDKKSEAAPKIVEARPSWDQTSGITVMHEQKPDGTLVPLYDEKGNPRYGAQGNKPFRMNPETGRPELAPKEKRRITDAGQQKLEEAIAGWRYSQPLTEKMLGARDKDGNWNGKGILSDKVVGAIASLQTAKAGQESQLPIVEDFLKQIWRDRSTKPSGGKDVPDSDKYTEALWFDENISKAQYALNALAFQLALTNNPDGRISDQDIKIARDMLGGNNPLSFARDARAKVASFFDTVEAKAVSAYIQRQEEDQIPDELRGAYLRISPRLLEPDQRERRAKILQQWGEVEPGSKAAEESGAAPPPTLSPPKPGWVAIEKDGQKVWRSPEAAKELVEKHGWTAIPGGGMK